jgi:hypothetical protein
MEIDTELVSPIRTHTRFSDRFKTLFQESPPQELTEAESVQKSPLVSYSSPKKAIAQEPKLIRTIIKNEDRGQWREASSPKRMEEKVVKEKEMITQETAPKETPVETKKAPKVTKSTKVSKIPAPSPSVSTTKSTPHYMMATTSFMSKFDSKKRRETLGVRSVGKISVRI